METLTPNELRVILDLPWLCPEGRAVVARFLDEWSGPTLKFAPPIGESSPRAMYYFTLPTDTSLIPVLWVNYEEIVHGGSPLWTKSK